MSEKYLGYVKYEGKLVQDGLMDAKRQAHALLGLDSALRFYISKQSPELRNLDFEIPVRIRKGSWEALIPDSVGGWVQGGLGIVATAYFTKAAQKMAEKDFADVGVKDLFLKAIDAVKWFARIGKHIGDVTIRTFENAKFLENNSLIGIPNEAGEYLYVPKYILDLYVASSPKMIEQLSSNVEEGRDLVIGTIINEEVDEEIISSSDKHIFCEDPEDDSEDVLFPELVHGDTVVLEGEVTRENKTSNSMGFKYLDHILTAYPESDSIVRYKPLLFLRCRLYGRVDRIDEKGRVGAKRPKLYFTNLEPLEPESGDLFNDGN